jgi:hypothetical protein
MATYLSRTQSSSNQKIFTISTWVKRANITDINYVTNIAASGQSRIGIIFQTNKLMFYGVDGGGDSIYLATSALFRDTSAFYHITVAVDTTQATASDRAKLYVNGTRVTAFAAENYCTQNFDFPTNNPHYVGCYLSSNQLYNFYGVMSHYHYCDGYAYDASTFGESDSVSGIWKPKTAPSVTYGTNGFFLKFENSGAMGTDSSGNGNNFTVSGTLTQNVDTPSNNFTAWNVIMNNKEDGNWSNANLTIAPNGDDTYLYAPITFGLSAGKWYSEHMITGGNGYGMLGAISEDTISDGFRQQTGMGSLSNSFAFRCRDGDIRMSSSNQSYGSAPGTSDAILGMALDMDNKKVWYHINGTYVTYGGGVGNPASGTYGWDFSSLSGDTFFITCGDDTSGGYGNFKSNFGSGYFGTTAVASSNADGAGQGSFEYSVPSGFYSICTKNIKDYG